MANVTLTPATAFPLASVIFTAGAVATVAPATPVWLSPAFFASVVGTGAVAVALNVAGLPVRLVDVAVSVLAPAVVPSVQLVGEAMPLAFVVALPPDTDPPPLATAKVTDTPDTGLLFASVTFTDGATATALPAVADCAS